MKFTMSVVDIAVGDILGKSGTQGYDRVEAIRRGRAYRESRLLLVGRAARRPLMSKVQKPAGSRPHAIICRRYYCQEKGWAC